VSAKIISLADRIEAKRREIEASGFAQWEYAKPEEIKDCPSCGSAMELVKAEEGGEIEEPYFPKYPLRNAELPRKRRPATFWACSGCEHCEEKEAR
jgi:ssDNA-binding Zn-finger/Zn-ribbon topoisomerase 1